MGQDGQGTNGTVLETLPALLLVWVSLVWLVIWLFLLITDTKQNNVTLSTRCLSYSEHVDIKLVMTCRCVNGPLYKA